MTVQAIAPAPATPVADAWQAHRTQQTVLRHLGEALRELRLNRGPVDVFWQYHDGEHVQIWYNDSLRKAFGGTGMSDLQDNYCALVVGAPLSRLAVEGWRLRRPDPAAKPVPPGEEAPTPEPVKSAAEQWDDNDMDLELDDVIRGTLVAGASYIFVWPRPDADGQQAVHPETGLPQWDVVTKDARNVYVKSGAKMRSRRWAAQVWYDHDRWRASLYYSDMDGLPAEVVRLHTPAVRPGATSRPTFPQQAGRFQLDAEDPGGDMPAQFNGQCPMVPVKLDKGGKSWLRDAVPGQDKINKLAANKMVAAEFLAFPQRYVLTDQDIPDNVLRYSPAKVLQLDPGGAMDDDGSTRGRTQVGEFSTADLEVYDKSHQREVEKLFTIKQLPKHLLVNPGTEPSGDAIKADEGPFISFVQLCQRMVGAAVQDVQQLMGYDVLPVWKDPTVQNDEALSREFLNYRQGDVPLGAALRKIGWSEEQITEAVRAELEARAQAAEEARQQAERAALMFDQGRVQDETTAATGSGETA